MTPAHLSALWRDLAPGLGNHLWQSTLFAAAAGLLTFMLRKNHARARYWLWLAASVKFLIPFSLLVSLGSQMAWFRSLPAANGGLYVAMEALSQPFSDPAVTTPTIAQAAPPVAAPSLLHWLPALLVVAAWLCGFLIVLLAWSLRWRRISAALRESAPLYEGREAATLRRLERMAGTRTPIDLVLSRASMEPGIFGILRPVLIWPEGISKHLEDAHLEAILAHEVWHVRRRDNLAAALHMVVEALFWFHPLVWWLGARMVEERERACDEEVVELGSERQVYAESILKVCEFCVGSPLACVSGVTGSDLKKRMVYIMTERFARKLDFGKKLLLSTAGVLALALPLVFGLLNAPKMRAQDQDQAATPGASKSNVELIVKSGAGGGAHRVGMMYSPTGFKAMNTTLQALIQEAYGVQANQIAGVPDWAKTAEFNLEIGPNDDKSAPSGARVDQSLEQTRIRNQQLLQAALAERFKLALHPEVRELSTYALVVGDDGSKLQPAKPASSYSDPVKGPDGRVLNKSFRIKLDGSQAGLEGRSLSTSEMASHLSRQLGTVVVDKTGLSGNYDFNLNWKSDGTGNFNTPASDASVSSLLTAIQEQLGLKLEPVKGPMQVLVIDHAERPSESPQN